VNPGLQPAHPPVRGGLCARGDRQHLVDGRELGAQGLCLGTKRTEQRGLFGQRGFIVVLLCLGLGFVKGQLAILPIGVRAGEGFSRAGGRVHRW